MEKVDDELKEKIMYIQALCYFDKAQNEKDLLQKELFFLKAKEPLEKLTNERLVV